MREETDVPTLAAADAQPANAATLRAAAAALRADRPPAQLASIIRQLEELLATCSRDKLGFRDGQAVALGISGGRLRIACMHPDMGRFFGPAWQMPIGAGCADGDEQIVLLAQGAEDHQIHLHPTDPKYREIVNAVPSDNDRMYPGDGIADWHAYEAFGTRMSEDLLLSLGYFSDAELDCRRAQGVPLPPPALWVSSNMRRPFSLVGNALASLRTLRAGPLGDRVQHRLGRDGFRGLRLVCTGGIPQGGFSSSSALTLATKNAVNALYDLRIPSDLLVHLACQAEYGTGVRAGSLDQATEQMGRAGQGTLISSNPRDNYRALGTYPVPSERFRVMFPYSVERDRQAWRWSWGCYGESAGGAAPTTTEMRKLTGKAAEIAALLTRLPLDTDYFKLVEDDLVWNGRLSPAKRAETAARLIELPLLITRDALSAVLKSNREWLIGQLIETRRLDAQAAIQQADATLAALLAGWREPTLRRTTPDGRIVTERGVPLRAMVAYLFAEVAKTFHLIYHPDEWIGTVARSQRGDRCFDINARRLPGRAALESELDWERGSAGPERLARWLEHCDARPFDFNRGLDDAALAADPPPDPCLLEGTSFFRGLALLDVVEAMLQAAFGHDAVAIRVNAAGQGDFFQVHVDTQRAAVDDVKRFLDLAYYRRFGLSHDPACVEPHPGGAAVGVRLERFDDLPLLIGMLRAQRP